MWIAAQAWWLAPLLAGVLGYLFGRLHSIFKLRGEWQELAVRVAQLERDIEARIL